MATVFSYWITLEDGTRLDAHATGEEEFRFEVDEKIHPKQMTLPLESAN